MALKRDITVADKMFYDTDRVLSYSIFQGNPTQDEIDAGDATPQDVTGWTLAWQLRQKTNTAVLIEKTSGSGIAITGTYDADPEVNTQRIEVFLEDTDTYDPDASPAKSIAPGNYEYALKRVDEDNETILAWGKFTLLQAAAWE